MMRDPAFWWRKAGFTAGMLGPLGRIYGAVAERRMSATGAQAGVPVICVGNFTLGGAGKTPAVIMLAELFASTGKRVFCLRDRKSTRLNSSHLGISYAVF